ncbi:helix-turn-helix domain-containing protein [Flavobacterium azooxidireducens]|uniref:Helix-turn-helix domain-containing protein n=1 Tax=Flavobacterium azooxidireducens TaxID=1871076 RepID=A0ABY4KEX3_9FLAO|nr:helix-turn-helix transcriptional regulator [Flavobacterium azooxidireducens]UPQ79249.1 helix-turn-helix domain-containing protein [Flavobacterium azooxidireducens]
MEHQKLIQARKSKGFTQEQMASNIAMEQTTYSRKERGKSPISDEEWQRFAKTLDVTVEEIKESQQPNLKNEHCTFQYNSIGIQFISIPQEVLDTILKYNKKLEEENEKLKNEIKKAGQF